MEKQSKNYRRRLIGELIIRQQRNPSYSMRSFARDLGISPTALSQVINARRNFSRKNMLRVANRLSFNPTETTTALMEISPGVSALPDDNFMTLSDDIFQFMSDWYYFAILSLASTGSAKSDPKWISTRFGITRLEASEAIRRLLRLKLIQFNGEYIETNVQQLNTTSDVPSSAVRKLQHHHLRLAQESLERDPIDLRDMTSMTMAVQLTRIPKAKKMIKAFRRKLTRYLEGHGKGEEVYVLALQLFPVSRIDERAK
jgi:uncharacterized protein (TIGR02147 family)